MYLPDSSKKSSRFTIPEPLHDGSRRLRSTSIQFVSTSSWKKPAVRSHMSYGSILGVVGRTGEKVCIDRFYILTSCPGQHGLQGGVTFPVALKCKELSSRTRPISSSITQQATMILATEEVGCQRTLPLFCINAARCDVLFPGAAVASMVTVPSSAGGESTNAGKHEALSCSTIFPSW